jgi:hypothetical protein
VQIEINRTPEQSKLKITAKASDMADFSLVRQIQEESKK